MTLDNRQRVCYTRGVVRPLLPFGAKWLRVNELGSDGVLGSDCFEAAPDSLTSHIEHSKYDLKYSNRENIDVSHCSICENIEKVERHRIIPGKLRGTYDNDNVIAMCDRCHKLAHKLARLMEKQHGFIEWENLPKMVKSYLEQEY